MGSEGEGGEGRGERGYRSSEDAVSDVRQRSKGGMEREPMRVVGCSDLSHCLNVLIFVHSPTNSYVTLTMREHFAQCSVAYSTTQISGETNFNNNANKYMNSKNI